METNVFIIRLNYIRRFMENVSEYHSKDTTISRAKELAIILEEEINVITDIFGVSPDILSQLYVQAKRSAK